MKNDTEAMRAMLLDTLGRQARKMTTAQALAGMFGELAKVPHGTTSSIYVMPGEAATSGGHDLLFRSQE